MELHPPPAASLSLQLSRICAAAAPREQLLSCAFDLDHYRELLDAARAGGYRFADFVVVGTPLTIVAALVVALLAPLVFGG